MAILVACRQCEKKYKLPDKAAGKSITCKGCGVKLRVPTAEVEDVFLSSLDDAVSDEQLQELPPRTLNRPKPRKKQIEKEKS